MQGGECPPLMYARTHTHLQLRSKATNDNPYSFAPLSSVVPAYSKAKIMMEFAPKVRGASGWGSVLRLVAQSGCVSAPNVGGLSCVSAPNVGGLSCVSARKVGGLLCVCVSAPNVGGLLCVSAPNVSGL